MITASSIPLIKDVLSIFKLRIGLAIMMSAIGGMAITPGKMPNLLEGSIFALAVFLASASAGAFNHWAEGDLDCQMKRTASRPFASGRFRAGGPWLTVILALLGLALIMAAWSANWWAAFHTFMGAFTYGIVYTMWLKRRSWTNIIVGGMSGSFAVLAGAAAVEPGWQPEPIILSLVLFLWTPPHFWSLAIAARDDYASAGVPMLPVVSGEALTSKFIMGHTILLVGLSLLPAFWSMGLIYLVGAVIGGAIFVWTSIRLAQAPCRARAIQNFLASLLQLALLLLGTILDRTIGSI